MTEIPITDTTSLTGDLKLSDGSPLSKSKLSHLHFLDVPVIGDFDKPLDQIGFKEVSIGADIQSPATLLADGAKLTVKTGASGSIAVTKNPDKDLFGVDPFCPRIAIGADDCWLKVELDTTVEGKVAGKVDGIGLSVDGTNKLALAAYSLIRRSNGAFPSLRTALETALENFSVDYSAQAIRSQKPGTVYVTESGGEIKFGASYSIPLSVSALASADLPFNYKLKVQPENKISLGGELALTGDFIVRCHKLTAAQIELGVYKKHGIAVQATFTASSGIGLDTAKQDILNPILGAVLPGVTLKPADPDLEKVLKDSIDHHLAVSVNAQFTDSLTDEAAVVYSIDLSAGNTLETDLALSAALRGDWTQIAALSNAQRLRNVFVATRDTGHKLRINLLGVYNAETLDAFTRSCTILRDDETGQLTITDKIKATHISVAARPLAADPKKLQSALAEAYLATVTYSASSLTSLTVSQTYFRFANALANSDMRKEMLLAKALGQPEPELNARSYRHARIEASVTYDTPGAQKFFAPRTKDELESLGRRVLASLLDPADPTDKQRIASLQNDAAWTAMNKNGNTARFHDLPELSNVPGYIVQDLADNWIDITTWAKAVTQVGPALRDVLNAKDADLNSRRKALRDMLSGVAKHSRAAFADAWGLAVAAEMIGSTGVRNFAVVWDGISSVVTSAASK